MCIFLYVFYGGFVGIDICWNLFIRLVKCDMLLWILKGRKKVGKEFIVFLELFYLFLFERNGLLLRLSNIFEMCVIFYLWSEVFFNMCVVLFLFLLLLWFMVLCIGFICNVVLVVLDGSG